MNELSEVEWKRLIERRRKGSRLWQVIHFLGSLQFAVILLLTIGLACAVATFYESSFNTKVAQAYIYKAPWFVAWLCVLCVNLAAVTATRWPWRRKHIGFVVTHAGIIILLIGAMIGQRMGFEASINLRKGEKPADRLVLDRTILQIDKPEEGALYTIPLDVELRPPSEQHPRILPLPSSKLRLEVDAYAKSLEERTGLVSDPNGGVAGVELKFASGVMTQTVPITLLAKEGKNENRFFGRAHIVLRESLEATSTSSKNRVRETQVIFAHAPDKPVIVPRKDQATHKTSESITGWRVILASQPDGEFLLELRKAESPVTLKSLKEALTSPVSVGDATFRVREFWPDFVMENGLPRTASDQPNNPAVMVEIEASEVGGGGPAMELALNPTGGLAYRLLRDGTELSRGTVAVGEAIKTGWADWQATVVAAGPNMREQRVIEPVASAASRPNEPGGIPGIHARLLGAHGERGEPVWMLSGRASTLLLGSERVDAGFGLQTRRVPFTIELLDFKVPRDPGTDQPANFISKVRFENSEGTASKEDVSKMNHPASYPGGFWRVATGINYKFSQASWNPENLNETTLQVLYDPGWLFKWVGSLGICLGITIMFYFTPKGSKSARKIGATSGKSEGNPHSKQVEESPV